MPPMLKVLFKINKIQLRLKEAVINVILIHKAEHYLLLQNQHIINGVCLVDKVNEFYLEKSCRILTLQIILINGEEKKVAGSLQLDIGSFEENIYHHNTNKIYNSPDKNSIVEFQFYFFQIHEIHQLNCQEQIDKKMALQSENLELHKQAQRLSNSNFLLEERQKILKKNLSNIESQHWHTISELENCTSKNKKEAEFQREKKEDIYKIMSKCKFKEFTQVHEPVN